MQMYEPHHAPLATRRRFARRMAHHFAIGMLLIGGSLAIGILGYHYLEGMHWIDAYLNAAMLLGGMGPVAPELTHDAAKLFAGVYALYSGIVVLAAASIMLAPILHRLVHRLHLEEEKTTQRK